MSIFPQYAVVSVLEVARVTETYNGWKVNQRSPQVGDVGTIVEILQADGLPDHYVVECSDSNGFTIWLGEFLSNEIAPSA